MTREGLLRPAPALLLVDAAAERVHHGVQVGADLQAVEADVVTGVADDGDLGVGGGRLEAAQETGTADSAGQSHDAHASSRCQVCRATRWTGPRGTAHPRGAAAAPRAAGRRARVCIGISVSPGE